MRRREVVIGLGMAGTLAGVAKPNTLKTGSERASADLHTPSADLFVREWGVGSPVVFTHSLGLSSDMWNAQVLYLAAAGFRCITFDRRGHGRSSVPASGYDIDTLADDLARVIDRVEHDDVALVGHSMGAGEICRYLARHGTRRVRRLALLAPTTPYLKAAPDNPTGLPTAFVDALHESWSSDFPAWVQANKRPFFVEETSPAMMDWLSRLMLQTALPVILACNQAMIEADHRAGLSHIDKPVLILHGDKDVSAPIQATGMPTAEAIPNAHLKVYPGAPHGLFVTHARQVNNDLLKFLRSS